MYPPVWQVRIRIRKHTFCLSSAEPTAFTGEKRERQGSGSRSIRSLPLLVPFGDQAHFGRCVIAPNQGRCNDTIPVAAAPNGHDKFQIVKDRDALSTERECGRPEATGSYFTQLGNASQYQNGGGRKASQ